MACSTHGWEYGGPGVTAAGLAAATAGTTDALGQAAAVNASANRSVPMMSRVNNPIFFMYSSSSEFRLGRSQFASFQPPRTLPVAAPERQTARDPHSIVACTSPSLCKRLLQVTLQITSSRHSVNPRAAAATLQSPPPAAPRSRPQYRTVGPPAPAVPNAARINTPRRKSLSPTTRRPEN